MLEGFELGVLDYLVKPVRFERFEVAARFAIELIELLSLKTKIEKDESAELIIKSGTKKFDLKSKEISHIQAWRDYVLIFCNLKKYMVRATMKDTEELLGSSNFVRVHKSFIVAKENFKFYSNMKIEFENFEIPLGRKYKKFIEVYLSVIPNI